MEVHFVHALDGDLAVVGALMVVGDAAADGYAPIFANLPNEAGVTVETGETLVLADLLPEDVGFTTYTGSLTTPPCSEGVRWLVLDAPVVVTAEQVAAFEAMFPVNARPVQAVNGRDILHDVEG
jgi:carbonic anhydrase